MAKRSNGRGWPLRYDRQLTELAKVTNSLEVLVAALKRSPTAILKRARRLGISVEPNTSVRSKPSERLRASRSVSSARAKRTKAQ